ncbi:MAG TPA: hypothetical protein VJ729_12475 [Nitrososphaeraceae archaeon]|nr:hypothetical protein [Nitrososphaeraceae archaeon]
MKQDDRLGSSCHCIVCGCCMLDNSIYPTLAAVTSMPRFFPFQSTGLEYAVSANGVNMKVEEGSSLYIVWSTC